MEYTTTIGFYIKVATAIEGTKNAVDVTTEIETEPPRPPGDGWELVSTAAADGCLFATWKRGG